MAAYNDKIRCLILLVCTLAESVAFLRSSPSLQVSHIHPWSSRGTPSALTMSIHDGVLIGGGRIGNHLFESNNKKDVLLTSRDAPIPPGSSGPIYVCTRNNDLDAIIEKTPDDRREDLVFLQNGILTDYLKSKGLESNTQALVYYAVSKMGEKPIDGITDLNPDGLTAVTGKWAEDFAARLKQAGLSCHVYEKNRWMVAMLEKHIWICAFMAVGAKHGCTVGEVEKDHNEEVRALISELKSAAAKETGLVFSDGVEDRLCAYARSVAHFPTALKEFEWRNGWFVDISLNSMSRGRADPCPLHTKIMSMPGVSASTGNLFYLGRKAWIARKKEEFRKLEQASQEERDSVEYAEYLRLVESGWDEEKIKPKGPFESPSVLKYRNKSEEL